MSNRSKNFVEALARGLFLVSIVSESELPLSLTELSKKAQLSKSTIQRLTYTLLGLGWLDRDHKTKKFRVGPKMILLSLPVMKKVNLSKIALPYMQETASETGEAVCLSILSGSEVIYTESIRSRHMLNIDISKGTQLPSYCTSGGKVLLSFSHDSELESILPKIKFTRNTPNTITSKKGLLRELRIVREKGFAICDEEFAFGSRSVAAPVKNALGNVIGAILTIVPTSRVSKEKLETVFANKIMETAAKISFDLGYRDDSST